jgi:hypothetical protein
MLVLVRTRKPNIGPSTTPTNGLIAVIIISKYHLSRRILSTWGSDVKDEMINSFVTKKENPTTTTTPTLPQGAV